MHIDRCQRVIITGEKDPTGNSGRPGGVLDFEAVIARAIHRYRQTAPALPFFFCCPIECSSVLYETVEAAGRAGKEPSSSF